MTTTPAIDIRYMRVDYGNFVAVDDLTISIPPSEVFSLVGPNGAGKTSAFCVLTTLLEPTCREVILSGVDVLEDVEVGSDDRAITATLLDRQQDVAT